MHTLTDDQLGQLCYFVNDWLRLMGFGGEYKKLSDMIYSIYLSNQNFDFSKYWYITNIISDRK